MVSRADSIARSCAEKMYRDDHTSHWLGIQIEEVRPGRAIMRMRVTENMINGLEIVHGGVLFTLADAAFAYACNAYDRVALAQACNIDYWETSSPPRR